MTRSRSANLALLLAACAGSGSGTNGGRASAPLEPTVRDSAGIMIYEHPADALAKAPLLTVDTTPLAVFAGDVSNPDNDVSALMWPIFLASGDLISYDRQAKQLLTLNAVTGAMVRLGRSGSGPLEIGSPGRLVLVDGDSVLFSDNRNDRVVIAHPDSGVVREFSRQVANGLSSTGVLGRLSGGTAYLLSRSGTELIEPGGRSNYQRQLAFWRVGQDSVRGLFSVPNGWLVWVTTPDGGRAGYGLAFSARTSVGTWSDGFLIARGEGWRLEQWDTAGQLHAQIRINAPRVAVDDAMFERFVQIDTDEMAQYGEAAGRPQDRDSIAASVRDRGHADFLASYGPVNVAPNGTMWVTDFLMPGDSGWAATAVAPDGRLLGRLSATSGDAPIAWGDDRVAIKTEDAVGIATITILKVVGLR